ncbi:MAG: leucyl aminopeptidase [Desulfobacteraceae bacterium]|nr:leucyl aminopeptidase [Desulfobacteraceae bacterium]
MISLKSIDLSKKKVSNLVVPVCEDAPIHDRKALLSLIEQARIIGNFKGGAKEVLTLYDVPGAKVHRITFIGLGELNKIDLEKLRVFTGKAVRLNADDKQTQLTIAAPVPAKLGVAPDDLFTSLCEGVVLGNHTFSVYKKSEKPGLKKADILTTADLVKACGTVPEKTSAICRGTILARDWVTTPSNDKKPATLATSIKSAASKTGLKVTVLDEKELKQKKFGAMLAVSAGSNNKPRLVILDHKPKKVVKTIVLVGKGVTFDSGGINLKPSAGMELMKSDMAGAAAVAGTLISIATLKPDARVIGVLPLVENMPSGTATRPGDIITSFAGKTVEIGNTDAEGRLILADAIAYANKIYKPDTIIDMATLTGACVMALGEKIAGVFTHNENLARQIVAAGGHTQERCWQMPMPDDYREYMKSKFADICNMSSSRWGGAITAALFLSAFAESVSWAHIDIAGVAYSDKGSDYCGPGGTGFGVRLLNRVIEQMLV